MSAKAPLAHIDRSHAVYSPSASSRWLNCHGSVKANQGVQDTPSDAAIWGTECHEAAGEVMEGTRTFEAATAHLTDEQVEMVGTYLDFVYDLDRELNAGHTWVETNFVSPNEPKYSGTADFAAHAGGLLTIVDLKTGFVPVKVRDDRGRINPQLGSYALLVYENLPYITRNTIHTIDLWIVQPRVHYEPIKVTIDIMELVEFGDYVYDNISEIEAGDETRYGGEHCKYCAVRGNCKAQRAFVLDKAKADFTDPVAVAEQHFTDAELGEASRELEAIEIYVQSVREQIQRRLMGNHRVDGWKLVERRKTARWTNPERAERIARQELGASAYRQTLRTPKQIEKALEEANSWADISDCYETKSAGFTIARVDDRRPAASRDPGKDFDDG